MTTPRTIRTAAAAAIAVSLGVAGTVGASAATTSSAPASPSTAPSPGTTLAALKARCNDEVQPGSFPASGCTPSRSRRCTG